MLSVDKNFKATKRQSASGITSERTLKIYFKTPLSQIICKEVGAAFQAGFLHIHLHPRLRHGLPPLRLCCLPGRVFTSLNLLFYNKFI